MLSRKPTADCQHCLLAAWLVLFIAVDGLFAAQPASAQAVRSLGSSPSNNQHVYSGQASAASRGRAAAQSGTRLNVARLSNASVRPAQATSDELLPSPHSRSFESFEEPHFAVAQTDCQPCDGGSLESAIGCDICGCETGCVCDPVGYLLDWSRCDLFAGITSFTTAGNFLTTGQNANGQIDGAFGFQEGFNFGSRAAGLLGGQVGAQIGLRAIQSQLDGSFAGNDARNQLFVTTGLFRRVDYGVQGGLVVDYLHDDGLYSADLVQLRGELSFLLSACHDLGARFTANLRTADSSATISGIAAPVDVKLSTLDSYRFFYRVRLGEAARGQAELHAGFTEAQDGLIGMALSTPLQGSVGLNVTGTYLFPHSSSDAAYANQSWNAGMALVWTPYRSFGRNRDYYRPLFDVADNGSLLMRRQ